MARYSYPYSSKSTVEGSFTLPISFLKQHGYLDKGKAMTGTITWSRNGVETSSASLAIDEGNNRLRLWYTFDNEKDEAKKHQDYTVPLVTTPCHFGGVRHWFSCPECSERVGVLYRAGKYRFACRQCWNLTYASRNLSGWAKRIGVVKNCDEIDKMRAAMRMPSYRGEFTKRHRRLIKAERKLYRSFRLIRDKFGLPDFPLN